MTQHGGQAHGQRGEHGSHANTGERCQMSMVFQVKVPAAPNQVKAGDKIRFNADKIDGAFTVTHIEAAK